MRKTMIRAFIIVLEQEVWNYFQMRRILRAEALRQEALDSDIFNKVVEFRRDFD